MQINSSAVSALTRLSQVPALVGADDAQTMVVNLAQMAAAPNLAAELERMEQNIKTEMMRTYGFPGKAPEAKSFAFHDGVAVIPIHGSLINRFGGFYGGYVTGYDYIRRVRNEALADPDVKAIFYDINSGGGEAAGAFELARETFAARDTKPSISVVNSSCYSAAYIQAVATDKIVVTPSGGAGSIGAVTMHVDISEMLSKAGVKVEVISAGKFKAEHSQFKPLTEDTRNRMQSSVDALREEFITHVAAMMGIDAKGVRETEARCYSAQEALALGLIHEVASPAEAVAGFLSGSSDAPKDQPTATAETDKTDEDIQMEEKQIREAAMTAERARVSGIMGCEEAKGREALAQHFAFNTGMDVEDAKAALAAAPKAEAAPAPAPDAPAAPVAEDKTFETLMDGATHPGVKPDGKGGDDVAMEDLPPDQFADRMMADFTSVTGDKE